MRVLDRKELEELRATVEAEKLERRRNAAAILDLREIFGEVDGTVSVLVARAVEERAASTLLAATEKVQQLYPIHLIPFQHQLLLLDYL